MATFSSGHIQLAALLHLNFEPILLVINKKKKIILKRIFKKIFYPDLHADELKKIWIFWCVKKNVWCPKLNSVSLLPSWPPSPYNLLCPDNSFKFSVWTKDNTVNRLNIGVRLCSHHLSFYLTFHSTRNRTFQLKSPNNHATSYLIIFIYRSL